jgi:hypothetical protein
MSRCSFLPLRLLFGGAGVLCWLASTASSPAVAATLTAQLFPKTGEVRLKNTDPSTAVQIVFYSIKSDSGALNGSPGVWTSVSDRYDAPIAPSPGNGFVDPNGAWIQISTSTTELAEGALDADAGRILPQRSVSLGQIWNPNATTLPDLTFTATSLNGQPIEVFGDLAIDGDYFPGGVVDSLDYIIWRLYYGSTAAPGVLLADGNLNGIVDAADYVVWRNNLGMSVPGAALSAASGAGQPATVSGTIVAEPAASSLAIAFGLTWLILRQLTARLRIGKHASLKAL